MTTPPFTSGAKSQRVGSCRVRLATFHAPAVKQTQTKSKTIKGKTRTTQWRLNQRQGNSRECPMTPSGRMFVRCACIQVPGSTIVTFNSGTYHQLSSLPPRLRAGDSTRSEPPHSIFPFSALTTRSALVADAQCPSPSRFRTVKHAIPKCSVMSLITRVTNRAYDTNEITNVARTNRCSRPGVV